MVSELYQMNLLTFFGHLKILFAVRKSIFVVRNALNALQLKQKLKAAEHNYVWNQYFFKLNEKIKPNLDDIQWPCSST